MSRFVKHRQIGKGIDVFGFAAGNRKDMMNVQIGRQVSELGLLISRSFKTPSNWLV